MTLLIVSFLAGVLTIAAPCTLPLIPVIVGGSLARDQARRSFLRPLVITLSLALSIVVFTLALKLSTVLLGVPTMALQYLAGTVVALFGIHLLVPSLWERIAVRLRLQPRAMHSLAASQKHRGLSGDIMLGAALGPVFSSCSPTYALIVAAVLPQSLAVGILYLLVYALGLSLTLLVIVYLGREFAYKLGWLTRPHGVFIRVIGVLMIITGLLVVLGIDKTVQTFILDQGWYEPIEQIEKALMR